MLRKQSFAEPKHFLKMKKQTLFAPRGTIGMAKIADLPDEDPKRVTFPCIAAEQPIGSIFVGVIPWTTLRDITYFDFRRLVKEENGLDTYLGIQRQLKPKRVQELRQYVNLRDASFPTG